MLRKVINLFRLYVLRRVKSTLNNGNTNAVQFNEYFNATETVENVHYLTYCADCGKRLRETTACTAISRRGKKRIICVPCVQRVGGK